MVTLDKIIARLRTRGLQRGFLLVGELQQELEDAKVSEDAFDAVLDALGGEIRLVEDDSSFAEDSQLGSTGDLITASDPIQMYLQEIGRVPLVTSEQEVELAMQREAGLRAVERAAQPGLSTEEKAVLETTIERGEHAKAYLVEANLRLVVSLAKKYMGHGIGLLDLVQEGNLGLMKAADRFDYRRGFRFSTYACWWIRQGIVRAISYQGRTIRVPVHVAELINKLPRARRELGQRLHREPTIPELAAALELDPAQVFELERIALDTVSLETPIGEEEDSTVADMVADRDAEMPVEQAELTALQGYLARALESLSPREREVLVLRFGLSDGRMRTLDEVSKHFHVTRERVRQLEMKALAKMREPAERQDLEGYLRER